MYSILIPTFERPEGLKRLLDSLFDQIWIPNISEFEIVIVDNSLKGSAKKVVQDFEEYCGWAVQYLNVSPPNIAVARNHLLLAAGGEWGVFLDDDQTIPRNWFQQLQSVCESLGQDVVAVITSLEAVFDSAAPQYLQSSPLYQRKCPQDHMVVERTYFRTAGTIIRLSSILEWGMEFDVALGRCGGEDVDFLESIKRAGGRIIFCPNVVTREHVSKERSTLAWILARSLRIGYSDFLLEQRRNHGTMIFRCKKLVSALSRLVVSISAIPIAVFFGRRAVRRMLEIAWRQIGKLKALVALRHFYYGE